MRYGNCPLCNARIAWLRVEGVRLPVDAEPSDVGRIVLIDRDGTRGVSVGSSSLPPDLVRVPRYVTHMLTCGVRPRKGV